MKEVIFASDAVAVAMHFESVWPYIGSIASEQGPQLTDCKDQRQHFRLHHILVALTRNIHAAWLTNECVLCMAARVKVIIPFCVCDKSHVLQYTPFQPQRITRFVSSRFTWTETRNWFGARYDQWVETQVQEKESEKYTWKIDWIYSDNKQRVFGATYSSDTGHGLSLCLVSSPCNHRNVYENISNESKSKKK